MCRGLSSYPEYRENGIDQDEDKLESEHLGGLMVQLLTE
jgi:hypothetical protein